MTTNGVASLNEPLQLYINGADTPASKGRTFSVQNPLTGKVIYECAAASVGDYEKAIYDAQDAFESWSKTSPSTRRMIFLRAADIMQSYLEGDAPEVLSSEVSAVQSWIKVNILATAAIFRETAGLATHIKGEIVPADRPGTTILVLREAIGVMFAISPWNAPVNLTARAVATPLICGNTIILKPSEYSPKSQHLVVRALKEAGLPPGCLNFLPSSASDAPAVTEFAVKHLLVRRINFTGSDRVGKIIAGWAASCLKPCLLECGGKAPVIVLDDANLEDAVQAILFGALSNSGQICMYGNRTEYRNFESSLADVQLLNRSTERVMVQESIADAFNKLLIERVKDIKVGNHIEDPSVSLSGLYCSAAPKRILQLVESAISDGAKLIYGDQTISGPNKTILGPHILDNVEPSTDIFQQETFGPIICVTRVNSQTEAVKLANATDYTLCASVFTKDTLRGMEVAQSIRAGSCHVNGPTVYIEPTLPNGGVGGRSGYGRFGGIAGVEEFTERKIVSLAKPGLKYPF